MADTMYENGNLLPLAETTKPVHDNLNLVELEGGCFLDLHVYSYAC